MELINNTFIPEKEIPRSRRDAERKAFLQTFRNLFTNRNPLRRFMDTYRFNTIRWSASNLHEPSWGKRIGLFLQTRNPVALLRDEYLNNRSSLLNKWETSNLNRIQTELIRIGRIPLQDRDRNTFKGLGSIAKKIKQLQGYEGCPDMSHEKQLLATYRYILSSPFDRKFGGLPPDEICGMLRQNGLSESNLPYQNYEGILQGRETVLYELATRKNGEKYLRPADQVKLDVGMTGFSMDLISRFPAKETSVPNLTEGIQVSEKKEKLSVPKEPKKKVRKDKAKSVKIK
ncbi:hypothetical protein BFGS084_01326 [Bacteroides fragilis]|nr:hypothetical protein [Bacteroides fragilis]WMI93916.1 hypothetical protein BFGS084_01326 [Bacteroides fragilis]